MNLHQLDPFQPIQIEDLPTSGKEFCKHRKQAEDEFETLRDELIDLQEKLYAEQRHQLLIIFQAMDAGGKDGTIRKVFRGVNPQGVRVQSFKVPSTLERSHDFLWRIHQVVPSRGMIGVFNRSHYEDVLVVRVDQLAPEAVWRSRYEHINHFEKLLVDNGTSILKFMLHISAEEQRIRFQERVDDVTKHWKFSPADVEKRKQWKQYMEAYQDVLNHCNTDYAPWHVVPADQNWYRNLVVVRSIVEKLREINPKYPEAKDDWSHVVVE